MAELIITNGDSAAELLRAAGRTETILPWRDVLHEGPILETADLAANSRARAPFLAARFHLPEVEVAAELAIRDALTGRHAAFATLELWFEHDLFDQLQLLQVLAFFDRERRSEGLRLVQADDFLGRQTPQSIVSFAHNAREITEADLTLASAVWREVGQPMPEAIAARARRGTPTTLPFLAPALKRFLEELPSPANGLSRTEEAILEGIDAGVTRPSALFAMAIASEEAAFMGDWSFFRLIVDLAHCEVPLIAGLPDGDVGPDDFSEAELSLTMAGDDVRGGEDDHVRLSGVNRWWAGTRLLGRSVWRYDRETRRLVAPAETGA